MVNQQTYYGTMFDENLVLQCYIGMGGPKGYVFTAVLVTK